MCLSKRAVKQITETLTSMDIVKTVSYSMFPKSDLNMSKLGFINKALIFGTGNSSEYDCRSPKEWEEQAKRFLKKGAIPTFIVCPVLTNKRLPSGKVVKQLNGYKDANLFSSTQVYGNPIYYKSEPDRYIDLKGLAERFNLDLGLLPNKLPLVSYFNEAEFGSFEVASYDLKKFIYSIVCRTVKSSKYRHQPAKDAIIQEVVSLSLMRSMGQLVSVDKNYHERIYTFGLYQRLSTLPCYFSILKSIEIVWDNLDIPVIE